jgi:hypothetical protein
MDDIRGSAERWRIGAEQGTVFAMKKLLIILMLLPAWAWGDSTVFNNDTHFLDAFIRDDNPNTNYGSLASDFLYKTTPFDNHYMMLITDYCDSIGAGQTIDSARLYIICSSAPGGDRSIEFHGCWKPYWVEDQITYNDWHTADSEWTDAGANCGINAGTFNHSSTDASCIGDSADITLDYIDSTLFDIPGMGTDDTVSFGVGEWADSAYQNNENFSGRLSLTVDGGFYMYSREGTYEPYLVVYHHASASADKHWKILK